MKNISETLYFVWSFRRAWWFTATARTRARFARTALGSFWLGLSTLFSIAILGVVYGTVFKVPDFSHYIVYLGTGLVTWNVVGAAVGAAPALFESHAIHIKNTNINPVFFTLEEWSFQVQTFFQSFILVVAALSFFQHDILLNLLLFTWLPLLNLLLFVYWVPFLICLLGAFIRDLYQLIPVVLQLIFLLSPILYTKTSLGRFGLIADINPFYRVLSPVRQSLMQGKFDVHQFLVLLIFNLIGISIALYLFERYQSKLPFLV